jgi:hypothetical protein
MTAIQLCSSNRSFALLKTVQPILNAKGLKITLGLFFLLLGPALLPFSNDNMAHPAELPAAVTVQPTAQ